MLNLKTLVCSDRELELGMMQMYPYLQARYHCLQQYLCPGVHLVLVLRSVHLVLLLRCHEVRTFWQVGYQKEQHGACSSYLHLWISYKKNVKASPAGFYKCQVCQNIYFQNTLMRASNLSHHYYFQMWAYLVGQSCRNSNLSHDPSLLSTPWEHQKVEISSCLYANVLSFQIMSYSMYDEQNFDLGLQIGFHDRCGNMILQTDNFQMLIKHCYFATIIAKPWVIFAFPSLYCEISAIELMNL